MGVSVFYQDLSSGWFECGSCTWNNLWIASDSGVWPSHRSAHKLKRELGTLERALLIADQHAPFHIVSVLCLESAPSPHILKQSRQILQNRHPFLRSRLQHEKGNYYFARLV